MLNSWSAITMALAVNELATNALKHGPLSNDAGKIEIAWSLDAAHADTERVLTWRWLETGGPPVTAPSRKGSGSVLIKEILGNDFGGSVNVHYQPQGVECFLIAAAGGYAFLSSP